MDMPDIQKHFEDLKTALGNSLVEREEETQLLLLGLLSGEHVLFVGPPGTGKSLLLRSLCNAIGGAKFFDTLMKKDTGTDQIFGFTDMAAVQKEQKWQRKHEGFLADADFAFIDEFWKGSAFGINSMLDAMNEREIHDGYGRYKIPLRMMVAASNEWPIGENFQEMGAAFDRFLIRKHVRPVSPVGRERLVFDKLPPVPVLLNLAEVDNAVATAQGLPLTDEAKESYLTILDELSRNGIRPGDRRIRKSVTVAKANAWLSGDSEVRPHHLEVLKHTLWEDPREHPAKTAEIVSKISNPMGFEINQVLGEADEALNAIDIKDIVSVGANLKKVEQSIDRLKKISRAGGNGRCDKAIKYLQGRCMAINKKILGVKD